MTYTLVCNVILLAIVLWGNRIVSLRIPIGLEQLHDLIHHRAAWLSPGPSYSDWFTFLPIMVFVCSSLWYAPYLLHLYVQILVVSYGVRIAHIGLTFFPSPHVAHQPNALQGKEVTQPTFTWTSCREYGSSGHTIHLAVLPELFYLLFPCVPRVLWYGLGILVALMIICAKHHYSVDVVSAWCFNVIWTQYVLLCRDVGPQQCTLATWLVR